MLTDNKETTVLSDKNDNHSEKSSPLQKKSEKSKVVDIIDSGIQNDLEIFVKRKLISTQRGWDKFKEHEIQQTKMLGLSNIVQKAEVSVEDTQDLEFNDNTVIVRIMKKEDENEVNAFQPYNAKVQCYIESQNIGPICIFKDNEIKCEEYLRGWQLEKSDMLEQKYRLWMMQPLADFLNNNAKKDDFGGKINQIHAIDDYKVLDILEKRVSSYELKQEEKLNQHDVLKVFDQEEIDFIKDLFKGFDKKDLFLVHGDCYYANCLYSNKRKSLTYIDFEYSCLNPFISDVAYLACECEFDYSVKQYPFYSYEPDKCTSDDDLREMIRALVCFWDNKNLRFKADTADEFESQLRNSKEFDNVDKQVVEDHFFIFMKCAIHCHFFNMLWSLWGLRNTNNELDIVLYARDRAKAYKISKEKYFKFLKARENVL